MIPFISPTRSATAFHFALAIGLCLALPALTWAAHAWLAVSSVTLSPASVTTGSRSTGTVTLDAPARTTVTVALSSTDARLASVPSSLTLRLREASKSFSVSTTNGLTGCATISARVGSTAARQAVIAVKPHAATGPLKLILPAGTFVGGQTVTGTVNITPAPTGTSSVTIQLSSSNTGHANVPQTITAPVQTNESFRFAEATFPITTTVTSVTNCPIITATHGSTSARVLLQLNPIGG